MILLCLYTKATLEHLPATYALSETFEAEYLKFHWFINIVLSKQIFEPYQEEITKAQGSLSHKKKNDEKSCNFGGHLYLSLLDEIHDMNFPSSHKDLGSQ